MLAGQWERRRPKPAADRAAAAGHLQGMLKALSLVLLLTTPAVAAPDKPPPRWSCWLVRAAVAKYGEAYVAGMARAAGISEAEIERGKQCVASRS